MSSPDPDRPTHPAWTGQHSQQQQPPMLYPDHRYSQGYPHSQPCYPQHAVAQTPYIQPHYGTPSQHFIAELPAPLPPAPPTATPNEQLKQDELLAHKLQNLEVAEARRRSSSAASQQQRPVSMVPLVSQPTHSPLLHQVSSLSLRPQSTSIASNNTPWSPGSFGTARTESLPTGAAPSTLPEVVIAPPTVNAYSDLPIPVNSDRSPSSPPPNDLPIPVNLDRNTPNLPPLARGSFTSLSVYLEEIRQVPYPPSWRLPPPTATFYAYAGSTIAKGSDWLSQQETFTWRTIRPTEHAYNPAAPSYSFRFATRGK